MRSILALALLLLAGLGAANADDIDDFIRGHPPDGLWLNGLCETSDEPTNATPDKIVADYIAQHPQGAPYSPDQYKDYRILETRQDIFHGYLGENLTVALICSAKGSKTILLLQLSRGFWTVRPFFLTTVP